MKRIPISYGRRSPEGVRGDPNARFRDLASGPRFRRAQLRLSALAIGREGCPALGVARLSRPVCIRAVRFRDVRRPTISDGRVASIRSSSRGLRSRCGAAVAAEESERDGDRRRTARRLADARILDIFWNDAVTRGALIVGLIVAVLTYAGGSRRRLVFPFVLAAVASYAVWLDDSPARYYDARIARDGKTSMLFDWIERTKPTHIVVRNFAAGMFSFVSPSSEVENANLRDDCRQAVRASAILILPTRLATPHCGDVVYEDARAIVLRP